MRWLRTVGDTVFLIGVGALAYFVIGLVTGWSYQRNRSESSQRLDPAAEKLPA